MKDTNRVKDTNRLISNDKQTSLPDTSLLICSRNRPQMLFELVESILRGDEVPTELIVIDDSNVPNELLMDLVTDRSCDIRYVWNQSLGLSRANNTGIAAARYDLLVFTQDDVLVTPTWYGTLVRTLLREGPRTAVTGKVLPGIEETGGGFVPSTKSDEKIEVYEGRIGSDVLYVQNMAIFRSAFDDIGGFDPYLGPGTPYPAAEDNDFAFRLLEGNYRIVYNPHAVVYHRAWRSESQFLKLHWNYGRGQGAFYAKYFSLRDTFMIRRMARDMFVYLAHFPIRLFRRRNRAYQDLLFVAGMLYGALQWSLESPKR